VTSLAAVRSRIAQACAAAGRDAREVTLVAVTKLHSAADVLTLARLGVHDIGESRDQEVRAKVGELQERDRAAAAEVRWHFVGRLQSRKCRSIGSYATAVHSLDRLELVDRLADGVRQSGRRPLEVFVQLSLDGDPERGGAQPAELERLADAVAASPELRLRGVMAVPPVDADAAAAFTELAAQSRRLRAVHPEADAISAGMSDDLAPAIAAGSTHVRVGTALLGRRDPAFG
jgi:hypothetical protein